MEKNLKFYKEECINIIYITTLHLSLGLKPEHL